MAKKRIGILTGGGDVPGLNAVIKSVTYRGSENDIEVIGLRRGWEALTHLNVEDPASRSHYGGRSTGMSAVPQIADDFGAPRKSAEVGHKRPSGLGRCQSQPRFQCSPVRDRLSVKWLGGIVDAAA